MGRITINELSSDLKEYLNGLGLTEAQVQELIDKFEDEKIGDISQLNTNSKDLVGAINELFQNANNGKELIASAIGNPLITGNSTFNAMSEAILGLRRDSENETDAREVLYNMMIEDGYDSANNEMTVDELIDLIDRSNIELNEIKQIACGYYYTFILKNDGSVWSCGVNDKGQLGLGDNTNRNVFTQVTTNISNDVEQVVCGMYHTFIIKNDGSLWSCGLNDKGQLGLGDTTNRNSFTQVTNDVKQVACGYYHTFIIKNDGGVWCCGYNIYGALGLGDNTNRTTFTKVTTNINNDAKQIACGWYHTIILKNDGSVWGSGRNHMGQLGLNDTTDRSTFTKVTTNINNDVNQIDSGHLHTYILKNDGSLWSCGTNTDGQLGLGTSDNNPHSTFTKVTTNINNDVNQIVCGSIHTFIIKSDGSVWSCGWNNHGQLGLGDTTKRDTFTQVTTNINNDVKQIAAGAYQAFIVKSDGSVWSCGWNSYGELGLNDTSDRNTFTNTNLYIPLSEYDKDRLALYNYLLSNDIEVTENMDISTMLNLLVDDYINKMILGYENNLKIILTDEGVNTSDEDDITSLIAKVDTVIDNKNTEMQAEKQKLVNFLTARQINVSMSNTMEEITIILTEHLTKIVTASDNVLASYSAYFEYSCPYKGSLKVTYTITVAPAYADTSGIGTTLHHRRNGSDVDSWYSYHNTANGTSATYTRTITGIEPGDVIYADAAFSYISSAKICGTVS